MLIIPLSLQEVNLRGSEYVETDRCLHRNLAVGTVLSWSIRRNVRGEILRLLNHQHRTYISREEMERIGEDSGLSPG